LGYFSVIADKIRESGARKQGVEGGAWIF
jgi:hypothetical protein